MFLYNVHTPNKTFALSHKEGESHSALIDRISSKASLAKSEITQVLEGKDGGSLVYEFENGRWSLEDDDDLSILQSRLPPSTSSGVTLHLTPPHPRAHFANSPPAYTTASNSIKSKAQQSQAKPAKSALSKQNGNGSSEDETKSKTESKSNDDAPAPKSNDKPSASTNANGTDTPPIVTEKPAEKGIAAKLREHSKSNVNSKGDNETFPKGRSLSSGFTALPNTKEYTQMTSEEHKPGQDGNLLGPPAGPKPTPSTTTKSTKSNTTKTNTQLNARRIASDSSAFSTKSKKVTKTAAGSTIETPEWMNIPKGEQGDWGRVGKARSVISNKSDRAGRNKWDEAVKGLQPGESYYEVHKQKWNEFHNNNGVRTVTGKIGDVSDVRMLLKSGYKQVYVSRSFAVKNGLVSAAYAMGAGGYTGLKTLGNVTITVGSKTASHPAFITEEEHFDVVLGRQWLERMAIKTDPLDETNLTYMDNGESIPCEIVVLKDEKGNVITIT